MAAPAPYLHFDGSARAALAFYQGVFGGDIEQFTFAEFGRDDGPGDAIAHGYLRDGAVDLFAADVVGDEPTLHVEGLLLSLLGAAEPEVLHRWFRELGVDGTVVDDLQLRPWGAWDGLVTDRFGLRWLIGYEVAESESESESDSGAAAAVAADDGR